MTNKKVGIALAAFTKREDALLRRAVDAGVAVLPERLRDWRHWVACSQRYLHDLKNFVEDKEKEATTRRQIQLKQMKGTR